MPLFDVDVYLEVDTQHAKLTVRARTAKEARLKAFQEAQVKVSELFERLDGTVKVGGADRCSNTSS